MSIHLSIPQEAATQAIAGQRTYREHLHRGVMLPMESEDTKLSGIGQAFWPTRRDLDPAPPIPPPIVKCQRCGKHIATSAGWWCHECSKIVPALQCYRGMSMVMIAAMGEYDPPYEEFIQDFAPWLLYQRLQLPRMPDESLDKQRIYRARMNCRKDRKLKKGGGFSRMWAKMRKGAAR